MYAGYTVPPYYDSLLAKVIVHGNDREEALTRMGQALDSFILEGVTTTIPFLARVIRHPDFVAGKVDTRFLERESHLLRPRGMKLDVVFTPAGLTLAEVQGRTVFVIDILRATTSMCAALSNGAQGDHPGGLHRGSAPAGADARQRRRAASRARRTACRIEGFHLGNSPLEMTEAAVRGQARSSSTPPTAPGHCSPARGRPRCIPPAPET